MFACRFAHDFVRSIEISLRKRGTNIKRLEKNISGQGPLLVNAGFCGLLHPIIHMDYAIGLDSPLVACEALTIAVVASDLLPTGSKKGMLETMRELRLDGSGSHRFRSSTSSHTNERYPKASIYRSPSTSLNRNQKSMNVSFTTTKWTRTSLTAKIRMSSITSGNRSSLIMLLWIEGSGY